MEILVVYRRGQSKKNNGKIRLIVQAGFTYNVIKRLIANKLSDKYMYKVEPTSIHIRAIDITIVYDHNDYRYNIKYRSKPHFRPAFKRQHISRIGHYCH